jgi:hypothetical protein
MSRSHELDSRTPSSVKNEVDRLIREGKYQLSPTEAVKLREKFKDGAMFELVMEHLNESHVKILNVAKKYYKYAQTQLLGGNKSIDYVLKQAVPFAKKVPLTDAEIDAFRRLVEEMIEGKVPAENSTYRHISSVGSLFGVSSVENVESMKDNLSTGDFAKVQDIIRLENANKALYQQVVLQSVQYNDCDLIAVSGKFDPERHNAFSHVNPMVAALYLPKFDVLDRTTLHAHLAGIVRSRFNREPLVNQVDKELFENIIYTGRREVCSMNPAEDLHRRVQLQHALWNSVIALRSGRYYGVNSDFVNALDQCHLTHVSPTNTVVNDEGANLRRIFGSFGLNTIQFTLKANSQYMASNAANLGTSLFVPLTREEDRTSLDSIITVDMSDFRQRDNRPYDFNEVLTQKNYYLDENDRYVQVDTSVTAVYKLLSIYVPRRKASVVQRQSVGSNSIANTFINFNQLPLTISGLSELNSYPVIAPAVLRVNNYTLRKRSVLVVEVIPYQSPTDQQNVTELVTSSSAIVYCRDNTENTYYYNPVGVVSTIKGNAINPGAANPGAAAALAMLNAQPGQEVYGRPNPVMKININGATDGSDLNTTYLESRQGTLFFYESMD